jgi:hypothetical protein
VFIGYSPEKVNEMKNEKRLPTILIGLIIVALP